MAPVGKGLPLYRRPEELARRVLGVLLEFALQAYGAAAALSVALSSSESVGGKAYDAVHALPNLMERYRQASYVVEHREQVQATLDYARDHAPDPQQLDAAVQRSSETVGRISTTFDEVTAAKDALLGIRPTNVLQSVPQVKEHVQTAWAGRPSLESIKELQDQAQNAQAFITQLNLQDPVVRRIYADLRTVLDNFASDEIAATGHGAIMALRAPDTNHPTIGTTDLRTNRGRVGRSRRPPQRSSSLVVSPHAEHVNDPFLGVNLVDETVLDVDPS